jgi:hypothetical protein
LTMEPPSYIASYIGTRRTVKVATLATGVRKGGLTCRSRFVMTSTLWFGRIVVGAVRMNTPVLVLVLLVAAAGVAWAAEPSAVVRDAAFMALPGIITSDGRAAVYVDSNCPSHWDGDTMYVFCSDGRPFRAGGAHLRYKPTYQPINQPRS